MSGVVHSHCRMTAITQISLIAEQFQLTQHVIPAFNVQAEGRFVLKSLPIGDRPMTCPLTDCANAGD